MKTALAFGLGFATLLGGFEPARAAVTMTPLTITVLKPPDAPVQMSTCSGHITTIEGRAGTSTALKIRLRVQNVSDKPATSVRIRLQLADVSGTALNTVFEQIEEPIAAGSGSTVKDFSDAGSYGTAQQVQCSVNTVKFADGTLWTEPTKP
jgi:hypothetical protein